MAETMEARIVLSADDKASPVIQRLLAKAKQLESQLKREFTSKTGKDIFSSKLSQNLVKNEKIIDYLDKYYVGVRKITKSARDWARGERDAHRMTARGFDNLISKIHQVEQAFTRKNGKLTQQERKNLRNWYQQASAYQAVWNEAYSKRMRLVDHLGTVENQVRNEQLRREQRAQRARTALLGREMRERMRMQRMAERQEERATRSRRSALVRQGRFGLRAGRNGVNRLDQPFFNSPFFYGMLGAGAAVAGTRRVLRSEGETDEAEINTRIFGGLSAEAARALRERSAGMAEQFGTTTAGFLKNYAEALKVGIPGHGAESFSKLSLQASGALGTDLDKTNEILGVINTIISPDGKSFNEGKLRGVVNALSLLANRMATTPEKMISFLQRGAGAASLLGMSMEQGLAFGAAATSLGIPAFSSGRMFDFLAGRITEMPRLAKKKGQEGAQARKLASTLGFGSANNMVSRIQKDPENGAFDLLERMGKIKNVKVRNEALRFFFGQEWLGEAARLVNNPERVREARNIAEESRKLNTLNDRWQLQRMKLQFVFKQIGSGLNNVLGELGMVLNPMVHDFRDYFLRWTEALRGGNLRLRFAALLNGLFAGFGVSTFPELLQKWFGTPGELGDISKWTDIGKGFATGLTKVAGWVKSFVGITATILDMAGFDTSNAGELAAGILGLAAALHFARPVLGLITGLATSIWAITKAFGALRLVLGPLAALATGLLGAKALKGALIGGVLRGMVAFPGAASLFAGIGTAIATAITAAPLLITLAGVALIGSAIAVAIMNWDAIREFFGGPLFGSKEGADKYHKEMGKKADEVEKGKKGTDYIKEFFGFGPTKSSLTFSDLNDSVGDLNETFKQFGAKIYKASDVKGSLGGFSGGGGISVGGGADPATTGSISRSFTPNMSVPSWHGANGGKAGGGKAGGGASISPSVGDLSGAGMSGGSSNNPILNMVAQAEGTAKHGYNTSFAHQFERRGVSLTDKTVGQIQQMQRGMRGSSAIGRYQFMRATLREAIQKGIVSPSDPFNGATQEKLGQWLLNKRGYQAWKAGKMSDGQFMSNLAHEWAGMTNPKTGRGVYPGQNTGFSVSRQAQALGAEKNRLASGASQTPQSVTEGVPTWKPFGGAAAQGAGGAGASGPVNIHVYGAGQDPESLAHKVQKRMQESMNWRTHDAEYETV